MPARALPQVLPYPQAVGGLHQDGAAAGGQPVPGSSGGAPATAPGAPPAPGAQPTCARSLADIIATNPQLTVLRTTLGLSGVRVGGGGGGGGGFQGWAGGPAVGWHSVSGGLRRPAARRAAQVFPSAMRPPPCLLQWNLTDPRLNLTMFAATGRYRPVAPGGVAAGRMKERGACHACDAVGVHNGHRRPMLPGSGPPPAFHSLLPPPRLHPRRHGAANLPGLAAAAGAGGDTEGGPRGYGGWSGSRARRQGAAGRRRSPAC